VLLSVDEVMLSLFDEHLGDKHDVYTAKVKKMLFSKSLALLEVGIDVILDWGFWTKSDRQYAKDFYRASDFECELHYLDIPNGVWKSRIEQRNSLVLEGKTSAYYVDDNLAKKFESIFEEPSPNEIDVWLKAE
jgi:predicted kinase